MKNKTYEKNDVKGAIKSFFTTYIIILLLSLYATDIINHASDITLNTLAIIRAIICFVVIIVSTRLLTKKVIKKFRISNSYKDNLKFNLNLIIIGVALLSIFYFLIVLNNNIEEVKSDYRYTYYERILGEEEAEEMLDEVKAEARKSFIIVWVSILISSAISAGMEGKIIDKYCQEDEHIQEINSNII